MIPKAFINEWREHGGIVQLARYMPMAGVLRFTNTENHMAPRPPKLSDAQRRALTYAYSPYGVIPVFPDDYFGIRPSTLRSLERRGLLKLGRRSDFSDASITPAGEIALGLSPHPASFEETLLEAMAAFSPELFPPESLMSPDEMGDVWVNDEAILDGNKIAGALSRERSNVYPAFMGPIGESQFVADTIACRLSAVGFEVETCTTAGQVSFVWGPSMEKILRILTPDDQPYDLKFNEFRDYWDVDCFDPVQDEFGSECGLETVPPHIVGRLLHEAFLRLEVPMHLVELLAVRYWWSSTVGYTGDAQEWVVVRMVLESANPKYAYVVEMCDGDWNFAHAHKERLRNVEFYVPLLIKECVTPSIWIVRSDMPSWDMLGLREPGRRVAVKLQRQSGRVW